MNETSDSLNWIWSREINQEKFTSGALSLANMAEMLIDVFNDGTGLNIMTTSRPTNNHPDEIFFYAVSSIINVVNSSGFLPDGQILEIVRSDEEDVDIVKRNITDGSSMSLLDVDHRSLINSVNEKFEIVLPQV